MDRRVTPPKRVTSPTWGPPPLCKQALRECSRIRHRNDFIKKAWEDFVEGLGNNVRGTSVLR